MSAQSVKVRAFLWSAFLFLFFLSSPMTATAQESPVSFPERPEPGLREGFANPPSGYGEVPFWWWTGEKLDVERLNWQLDELKKKGISGVQVNYAHQDVRNEVQPNWLTFPNEPEVLTDEWFSVFDQVREHCRELGMGIGISGYTLDWQNSPGNLFDRLIYSDKELQSRTIYVARRLDVKKGERFSVVVERAPELLDESQSDDLIGIAAYRVGDFNDVRFLGADAKALASSSDVAENDSQVWVYRAKRVPHTLNPLHPDCGKRVVERFFQPFEDRAVKALGKDADETSTLGLEYFFQDELQLGTGELVWNDDLPQEFESRKGYPLWKALPAMFDADCGDLTEKYRLDFMDVRVRLAEERYFIPIFNWNARRGRIYACDPGSRGRNPSEFCDYFSAIRWYTAPGHDTPGGHADFIKNKVSSSIAHFYNRPRVWLEGYHSFGWGATPERLLFATNENFLFGANLLNLHGLYYTTYGGYWEWAPPCYHFRQPYWETFGSFLKYFERLSFALTRGVEQPEFVVLYPVSAYQSRLGGARACDVAFNAAQRIFQAGHDVLFIDDDSVARAEIVDGRLSVAGASHRVFVLPSIRGIRQKTLQKAYELYKSGGVVIVLDALPEATDGDGRRDETLKRVIDEMFAGGGKPESLVRNDFGGAAAFFSTRPSDGVNADVGDKTGSKGAVSKLRRYPGGFEGHWVWSPNLERDVRFKWVATGLSDESKEFDALFFCDNAGSAYVNGRAICAGADYSSGWRGKIALRNGDVVVLDGHDDDQPRRGSAGLFFALVSDGKTVATAEDFRCEPGRSDDAWRKTRDGVDKLAAVDVGNVHVLHRTGVNSELGGAAPAPSGDDQLMWTRFDAFLKEFPLDAFDAETGAPCSVMKRATPEADVFFVMKGKKNAALTFRAAGRAELYNAWDGTSREIGATINDSENGQTTTIRWPYAEDQAGLVVFWRDEKPSRPLEPSPTTSKSAFKLPLDGEWRFKLMPTLDNRWGDFRLPARQDLIGAEAQRFDVAVEGRETAKNALNDFGPKYLVLGPFPKDADFAAIEQRLADVKEVVPNSTINVDGTERRWNVGSFSWRWGVEGNPGREGYHGLKERIDSRFIALGKLTGGFNEKIYAPEESGSVYYVWTTVPAGFADASSSAGAGIVDVYVGGGAPEALWVGGRRVDFEKDVRLVSTPGAYSPVLIRYDSAGRRACVFIERDGAAEKGVSKLIEANGLDDGAYNGLSTGLREETPDFVAVPEKRTPLATVWFDTPGVLDYDVYGGTDDAPRRLGFVAPPGLSTLVIKTRGEYKALYVEGEKAKATVQTNAEVDGCAYWRELQETERFKQDASDARKAFSDAPFSFVVVKLDAPLERAAFVEVEITPVPGVYDAALCPEPMFLHCEEGATTLGDWNKQGVLVNYSGGARYTKRFDWTQKLEDGERVVLDLGSVSASCRVWLNGRRIGDLPTPPWTIDLTDAIVDGENTLEIDVYNTAANIYHNIPTNYGANPPSGLMGPVELRVE